ncbi:transcriptional regulator NanR [Taklimakanibacter deserti]|uniref:transcriptional regulator NanR n=1 Tax=Taklimakanibacter deserti TaxID=2267839 RepID=UPI000E65AA5B
MTGIPAESRPIRPQKLYEQVAARLEARIIERTYDIGDLLPSERDLMREFGVGRPAIREALAHLRNMGLVELRSGERAQVIQPTAEVVVEALSGVAKHMLSAHDGVRNFQNARLFFEVGLARHAAAHATEDDIEQLRLALEINHAALSDLARFEKTDVAFHYVLAIIPRNPIFPAIHAAIAEWLVQQRHITLNWRGRKGTAEKAYKAHKAIYEAIAARDPERAERAMRDHLAHVESVFWEAMESDA